jgi:hypothetical protein
LPSSDAPGGGANPFAAFGSLTGSAAPKANPFSSLTSLKSSHNGASSVAGASKPATTGFGGFGQAQSPIKQKPASFGSEKEVASTTAIPSASAATTSSASNGSSNTIAASGSTSKIQKLNKSFLSWMDKQIVEHPVSVWSSGLQVS